jgi:transposase
MNENSRLVEGIIVMRLANRDHKRNIVACLITPKDKEIRTFGTMTDELLEFVDWVVYNECTHVAMESTGVYWKPVYNLLEALELEVLVVNAKHIKAVPGRKTDVKDAEWIADLLRHGLMTGSHIPDQEQRELRELVRYRGSLIQERSREINRIQKVLEGCNIKLSSVLSDINGKSGRLILKKIVDGEEDPEVLAKLAQGNAKAKIPLLIKALTGIVGNHQRTVLRHQLSHIEFLDQKISSLDSEIEEPF